MAKLSRPFRVQDIHAQHSLVPHFSGPYGELNLASLVDSYVGYPMHIADLSREQQSELHELSNASNDIGELRELQRQDPMDQRLTDHLNGLITRRDMLQTQLAAHLQATATPSPTMLQLANRVRNSPWENTPILHRLQTIAGQPIPFDLWVHDDRMLMYTHPQHVPPGYNDVEGRWSDVALDWMT